MNKKIDLKVISNFRNSNKILIHPNDGFELDLIMNSYSFNFYFNLGEEDFFKKNGEVFYLYFNLDSKCKVGTIEIPNKLVNKLGNPAKVNLLLKDNSILLRKI